MCLLIHLCFSIYSKRAGLLCAVRFPECSIQDLDSISNGHHDNAWEVRGTVNSLQTGLPLAIKYVVTLIQFTETPSGGKSTTTAPKFASRSPCREVL